MSEFRVVVPANIGLGNAFRNRRVFTVFKPLHGAPHHSSRAHVAGQGLTNFALGTPTRSFGRVHGKRRRRRRSIRSAGGTYTLKSSVGYKNIIWFFRRPSPGRRALLNSSERNGRARGTGPGRIYDSTVKIVKKTTLAV